MDLSSEVLTSVDKSIESIDQDLSIVFIENPVIVEVVALETIVAILIGIGTTFIGVGSVR